MPALLMASAVRGAATYYVAIGGSNSNPGTSASPYATIAKGLAVAKGGDTVVVKDGTYFEHDLKILSSVTLKSLNGPASTKIQPSPNDLNGHTGISLTSVGSGPAPVNIQGFTFYKGVGAASQGGALTISGSVVAILGCVFDSNQSPSGGAILTDATSKVSVNSCTFSSNSATGEGGAFFDGGSVNFLSCVFNGNSGSNGGAIATADGSTIDSSGCVYRGNQASDDGGPIYARGIITVRDSILNDNFAISGEGGAIKVLSGAKYIRDSLFYGNTSGNRGGAMRAVGTTTVLACTVVQNSTSYFGGGIAADDMVIKSSVLWGNHAGSGNDDFDGNGTFSFTDIFGGIAGTGNINADPLFLDSTHQKFQLLPTSPCLGAGLALTGIPQDILGRIRKSPPTMGAFEAGSLWDSVKQATGPDGGTRILWSSTSGQIQVWTIALGGAKSVLTYGPFKGWVARDLAVGPDNHTHILWRNATGGAIAWDIAPNGVPSGKAYGPYAGWTERSISVNLSNNHTNLIFTNSAGRTWLFDIAPDGQLTTSYYGPL